VIHLRALKSLVVPFALVVGSGVFVAGCATASVSTFQSARHADFTADRVLALKVGMSADSIVSLFGPPDRTRALTCGTKTASPWPCLIWEYDMGPDPKYSNPYITKTNSLTFSTESAPARLNDWTIDLTYESRRP